MRTGANGQPYDYVLIDLNTQRDFFDVDGACPVLDVDGVYRCLRRVVAWVKRYQVPVVSTMDAHRSRETDFVAPAAHCIEGTPGQSKLDFTLLPNRVYIAGDNTLAVPIDLFRRHQQVIFPQRTLDLFANPKADRFITQLDAREFIVYGAVAEREVKAVALGLLIRNKRVTIVADGCGSWNRSEYDLSLRQMAAKGARVISIDEFVTRRLPRRWRYTANSLINAHRPIGYLDPMDTAFNIGRPQGAGENGSNGHRA